MNCDCCLEFSKILNGLSINGKHKFLCDICLETCSKGYTEY